MLRDEKKALQEAFQVRRTPLVYLINEAGQVAMRSVANDLIDLEDTLNGIGRRQGGAPWLPAGEQGNR